jgi:arginyl-tRNA synthetase
MFKKEIIQLLAKHIKLREAEIEKLIEIPPNPDFGDYSFPCFVLSKHFKKSPDKVAEHLKDKIKLTKNIEKIQATGPYLNFFLNKKILAEEIIKINANFGKAKTGKRRKIAIDFSHPNVGKPMHIGHIRSTIIGDSLMRIYGFLGYSPIGINYLGDIGLHIGKLIVAYELWLDKEALKKDPVNELLRLYVKFCGKEKIKIQEGVDEEFQNNEWTNRAKEELKKLELGDKKAHQIWQEIQKSSKKGFDKVYEMLNINFTETTGQSKFSIKGKDIVMNALEKGIAKREEDGAVYVELDKGKLKPSDLTREKGDETTSKIASKETQGVLGEEIYKKYILRNNETASYITQDLGAAVERFKKYKFDKMIYVVDFRQSAHFDALFTILKLMKYDFAEKMIHLPFGTIRFGNEIIATRKGDIILLEDVLKKTIEKSSEEISKRKTKGDANKVGIGAVKYIILKNEPIKDVHFSWETALNFEGNTGPYLQYSYARASSIIRKAGKFNKNNKKAKAEMKNLSNFEINLIKKIADFPEIVERAGKSMNPSLIASYSFELAQIFNEFYHNNKVIGDKEEAFRLRLVDAFRTCLRNALYLLGIDVMEEM